MIKNIEFSWRGEVFSKGECNTYESENFRYSMDNSGVYMATVKGSSLRFLGVGQTPEIALNKCLEDIKISYRIAEKIFRILEE